MQSAVTAKAAIAAESSRIWHLFLKNHVKVKTGRFKNPYCHDLLINCGK